MQVTSPKCVDALRAAMLTPVKCEELFYRADNASRLLDNDDSQSQRGATVGAAANNNTSNSAAAALYNPRVAAVSAAADKLSGTAAAGTSTGDKAAAPPQHQCVYCALTFKTKGEMERHVKATHVPRDSAGSSREPRHGLAAKATHVLPSASQKCNICDEVFPSAAVLAEHKLTHCKVTETSPCAYSTWLPQRPSFNKARTNRGYAGPGKGSLGDRGQISSNRVLIKKSVCGK